MPANDQDIDLEPSMTGAAYHIRRPEQLLTPVVFASPHSGRQYPESFLAQSRLDPLAVRRSEDAFVDDLFACAADFGAPLLRAHFPRAYVDVNREPYELDSAMFETDLPDWVNTGSPRVAAGLGTVAKIVAGGAEIYGGKLDFSEIQTRIRECYVPYHKALATLVDEAVETFGCCLLVDCHSMPSAMPVSPQPQPDIVLGDCHGSSCSPDVSRIAERTLCELSLMVQRNRPYAGGFTTRHYARPLEGVQALQIEINRALYMDEVNIRQGAGFNRMAERIRILVARLTSLSPSQLAPAWAAE